MKKDTQQQKKLVLITGITGAIGSAFLDLYTDNSDTVIYGVSRKALPAKNFIDQATGKFPAKTLIASISNTDLSGYREIFDHIDFSLFREVIYIHGLGYYPFEVDDKGQFILTDDLDKDGLNDQTMKLCHDAFIAVNLLLKEQAQGHVSSVFFQSLADEHKPTAHTSWWKVAKKVKKFMKEHAHSKHSMLAPTISSVMCCHEILTRPYVFTQTDAQQQYWLSPYQLARNVIDKIESMKATGGYDTWEIMRKLPNFHKANYYSDQEFTKRKVLEIYKAQ